MKHWLHLIFLSLTPATGSCALACLSTLLAQTHDPAGITFAVTRTDCDTLAKDSAISVTAKRDGERDSALLLKYDPWANEAPQVSVNERGIITIHVSRASSILEQHPTWGVFKIKVVIDEIAYPKSKCYHIGRDGQCVSH
jgi:hypothetical protein